MKRSISLMLLALLASRAEAIVITSTGTYVINSQVDEIIVDAAVDTSNVWIQVVSGGQVTNNVACAVNTTCDYRVTVSGTGQILGNVRGTGALIEIRDNAWVNLAGTDFISGGRVVVSDTAFLGTVGASIATNPGLAEVNGGFVGTVGHWSATTHLNMNAGVVGSTVAGSGVVARVTDGLIMGSIEAGLHGPLDLRMKGGHVTGDLIADQVGMQGYISGGIVDGIVRTGGPGGGVFDIFGGQFGAGLWQLGGLHNFNVHGRDLVLANGFLTGELLDGSAINVGVNFTPTWSGQFNLYNVPEPGTLALFGIALLGAYAARRRRAIAFNRTEFSAAAAR